MKDIGPTYPPPHGLGFEVTWTRIIDGRTIDAVLPNGREVRLQIQGCAERDLSSIEGRTAKHLLETLLETNADLGITVFIPFEKICNLDEVQSMEAWLFAGRIRADVWMFGQGL